MENPIKDNRIVKDMTFAIRLLNFAKSVTPLDACSEEERDSMINYAAELLKYQIETVRDASEKKYLLRNKCAERIK